MPPLHKSNPSSQFSVRAESPQKTGNSELTRVFCHSFGPIPQGNLLHQASRHPAWERRWPGCFLVIWGVQKRTKTYKKSSNKGAKCANSERTADASCQIFGSLEVVARSGVARTIVGVTRHSRKIYGPIRACAAVRRRIPAFRHNGVHAFVS